MSAAPIVPVVVVVPPTTQAPSPRTLGRFNQDVQNLSSLFERMQTFCKENGNDLSKSATSLEASAAILAQIRQYEQERTKQEEQCQTLQKKVSKLQFEMEDVVHKLDEATKAALTYDKEKQRLKEALEKAQKAAKAYERLFSETDEKREEESNKRQEAEETARNKTLEAQTYQNDLQANREINAMLLGRLNDRNNENRAMQAQNQVLQSEINLHRQEKTTLEQAVRQQKAALQQKEQRVQGLEGRIHEYKGDLAQIQKQVAGLKDGIKIKRGAKTPERMKRISQVAIAILVALGVALVVGLVFWLTPPLAAAGSLASRGALAGLTLV